MNKKKIGLIILLIAIIAIVVVVIFNSTTKKEKNQNTDSGSITTNKSENETENSNNNLKEIKVSKLDDGTLYTTSDEDIKADIVVGDNYFDTQMADINLNFSSYKGKTIEIEGMYLTSGSYKFVGRYSTSNLCADCPAGFSYMEYEFKGDNLPELKEETDWIKVKGTLKSGFDRVTRSDYYYIDVISLEVMNERGLETVSN